MTDKASAFKIHFIGDTANNKLNVSIVGMITTIIDHVSFTAPRFMVTPPKHPTISRAIEMTPNLFSSAHIPRLPHIPKEVFFVSIFIVLENKNRSNAKSLK
jgi:hypothetical protein